MKFSVLIQHFGGDMSGRAPRWDFIPRDPPRTFEEVRGPLEWQTDDLEAARARAREVVARGYALAYVVVLTDEGARF
jgi:hypothetical protein